MLRQHFAASRSVGLVLLVASRVAAAQQGAPYFESPAFVMGLTPQRVVLGDFDADGHADWAATSSTANNISVRMGDGLGGFGAEGTLSGVSGAWGLAAVDFDSDGDSDLAASSTLADQVYLFASDGSGGFSSQGFIAVSPSSLSIAAGDFDGDSDADLVVGCVDRVVTLRNDGAWVFASLGNIPVGTQVRDVKLADVNADGNLDVIAALEATDQVAVALGVGGGAFGTHATFAVGGRPLGVVVGDVNGDGKADLATANFDTDNLSLLFGDGLGSFGAPTNMVAGDRPTTIAMGDLNGDVALDLVSTRTGSGGWGDGYLRRWVGNGAGAFTARVEQRVGNQPIALALGQINGDGTLDLVIADTELDQVSIHPGNGLGDFRQTQHMAIPGFYLTPIASDLDLDGRIDFACTRWGTASPYAVLFANRGAGIFEEVGPQFFGQYHSIAAGDLNGDGLVDLAMANSALGQVTVALCTGPFTYSAPQSYPSLPGSTYIRLADLNGDLALDAYVVGLNIDQLGVLLGDGLGGFGAVAAWPVPARPADSRATDLDGDGDLDVVVRCWQAGVLAWLLNDGTGQFATAQSQPAEAQVYDFVLADLDEDGFDDVVFANRFSKELRVLVCDGAGGFAPGVTYPSVGEPVAVATGDFNDDGHLDIAASSPGQLTIATHLGDGTGALAAGESFAIGRATDRMVCADFDQDGRSDLVSCNSTLVGFNPGISTLLNRSACAPIAYCTAGTTSHGCVPLIEASGTPSASAASGFVVTVYRTEGQRQGLFFYGLSGRKESVWSPGSSSFLCVKSPVQRTSAQSSGGTNGACDGSYMLDLASYWASHTSALGQPLAAGLIIDMQAWFRDPSAPGTTNLSGGLEFAVGP